MATKGTCAKCGAINFLPAGVRAYDGLLCGVADCTGALTRYASVHQRRTSIVTHARRDPDHKAAAAAPPATPPQVVDDPYQLHLFPLEAP